MWVLEFESVNSVEVVSIWQILYHVGQMSCCRNNYTVTVLSDLSTAVKEGFVVSPQVKQTHGLYI